MTKHETWQEFSRDEKLKIIADGLETTGKPAYSNRHVVVVGAGMAGLVAAYELQRTKLCKVTVLEARQTVGGRIRTIRDPFFSPGLYGEAGAMRIPNAHVLTMEYIGNTKSRDADTLYTSAFSQSDKNAKCHFNGISLKWHEYEEAAKVGMDCFGFGLQEKDCFKTIEQKFKEEVLEPLDRKRRIAIINGKSEDEALDELMKPLESYSTRRYLAEVIKWEKNVINAFGIVENQTARLNNSVVALLREYLTESFDVLYQINGGMDLLPRSFLPALQEHIQFGAKMCGLEKTTSPAGALIYYTLPNGEQKLQRAEYAIITTPLPTLRHLVFEKREAKKNALPDEYGLSQRKQSAIQGLNYSAAGKILFQCKERFWELEGITGGRSQTDLGIRAVWYPTTQEHQSKRAILLASYTWGIDSERWTHLSSVDRLNYAIRELAQIHPRLIDEPDLIEGGFSIMWQNDEFSGGAFALTDPYQEVHDEACREPEGRFHFAGEHTSLNYHRWIEGAVESGLRAAWEVYHAR